MTSFCNHIATLKNAIVHPLYKADAFVLGNLVATPAPQLPHNRFI